MKRSCRRLRVVRRATLATRRQIVLRRQWLLRVQRTAVAVGSHLRNAVFTFNSAARVSPVRALHPGAAVLGPLVDEFRSRGGAEAVELLHYTVQHDSAFLLRSFVAYLRSIPLHTSPADLVAALNSGLVSMQTDFVFYRRYLGTHTLQYGVEIAD